MANEIRRRYNFMSGIIDDNPLSNSATTLNSTELAGLPAVGAAEHVALVLDPTGVGNGPEIVYVTAHTGSATSATISRGREGTTGVQHASTIAWVHVATAADFGHVGDNNDQPSTGGLPYEGMRYTDTTNDQIEVYDGAAWQRVVWYSSTGRCGGSWSRGANLAIPNVTTTDITWSTETTDTDGFLTPTSATLTIPAGLGGLYFYDVRFTCSGGLGTGAAFFAMNSGGTVIHSYGLGSNASAGCCGVLPLTAADTLKFALYQDSGGSVNMNPATLNFYRLAI